MSKEHKMFYSIDDVRDHAQSKGSHFFDKDTMKFFQSRLCDEIATATSLDDSTLDDSTVLFVSSERDRSGDVWKGARRYTVRSYDVETGRISKIGKFGQHSAKQDALYTMRCIAREWKTTIPEGMQNV